MNKLAIKNVCKTCTEIFINVPTKLYGLLISPVMDGEEHVKKQRLENEVVIKEGEAEILAFEKNVFYNPVQEFNRDLSIAVLTIFARQKYTTSKDIKNVKLDNVENKNLPEEKSPTDLQKQNGITILEALSATGLRSIRYAKEIPGVRQIIANDISAKAVESIKRNIHHNKVEDLVYPNHEEATMVMYKNRKNRFDVVDLDPYGCPSVFLDGAVQCISEGGILLVTATDMAVLAGNSPETCYIKYGAMSIKSEACHEIALRILLQHIAAHAGRYGRYIVPLLSISVDFYIRVFVKVFTSQLKCKDNASKIGMVYQCMGCESMSIQPLHIAMPTGKRKLPNAPVVDRLCQYCQGNHHVGGPIWLGRLHDQEFISELLCSLETMTLGTKKRMEGVLNVVHEELDIPLYYKLDRIMSIVRCHTPQMIMFRSALLNAGYDVSYSHANKISIKTNAPNDVIWDIVRAWEKQKPANREKFPKDSPGLTILNKPSTTDISFTMHPNANPASRRNHLIRFQRNPTSYWGPGTRSTMMINANSGDLKKIKNQNKKSKKQCTIAQKI